MTDHNLQHHANRASDDYLATKLRYLADDEPSLVEKALLRAAADRLGADTFPSRQRLEFRPTSKGTLIERLYPGMTVDSAVPQAWVDRVHDILPDDVLAALAPEGIQFHFCTVYDHTTMTVQPLTRQGIDILAALVSYTMRA